mmetsp:Transcript_29438/g.29167  ORF Transcript_29438/g.29167 Transcript_29438/m.29167 type:complete len:264 (+) Transcript_29438:187-978(+)
MKDIEDANKIFFKCLEMGFDNINSRFAAEFFDSFESAAEYLTEWAKLDELGKIKSQIYYTAKEMGKDEATARKAGINFDSLEEAIKFLSIEEETKQDENFVINQPPEENENSKIIYEICQEMGLSEEKSILVAHSCTDIEDAIEFATTIKNEETFVLNTQDFNIPSQARIDKEKERLISGNFEGYFGNKLIKSNEEGLFYIYDPCQNELIGEEETKEDIQIEICLAEIENKLNGANIPAGRSAEEFNAEEVLNEEIKENNEER